jgi:hypothetical protein
MKNILYIIAFAITGTFLSCSSEISYYDTLSDEQRDQAFGGSIEDIQDLIGIDAYNALKNNLGIDIYEGNNPPIVEGSFPIWLLEVAGDILDPSTVGEINGPDDTIVSINLQNQNNTDLTIGYRGFFLDPGPDQVPGGGDDGMVNIISEIGIEPTYISGDSSTGAFTILGNVDFLGRIDAFAISGIKTANGINNLKYAYVEYADSRPDSLATPPFIDATVVAGQSYKDTDGISESYVWNIPPPTP